MNLETISKLSKVLVPLLSLLGVNITPEETNTILSAGVIVYSIFTGIEAWLKAKNNH